MVNEKLLAEAVGEEMRKCKDVVTNIQSLRDENGVIVKITFQNGRKKMFRAKEGGRTVSVCDMCKISLG